MTATSNSSTLMSVSMFRLCLVLSLWFAFASAALADIGRFAGTYTGAADVVLADGSVRQRDMSVEISETKTGFSVAWRTTTYRDDGRSKEKSYEIEFLPSVRDGIFAAAMTRNVFGHSVQQDPMKGEPYVWARIIGDTLTVYSLFVNNDGGYELQQFDRTLAEGGLMLEFSAILNGAKRAGVQTLLLRR